MSRRRSAARLCAAGDDLSRRALEALIAEEYRLDHLDKPDLRRLLGFETSYEIDGFLKAHNVYDDYTMKDFEREQEAQKPGIVTRMGRDAFRLGEPRT